MVNVGKILVYAGVLLLITGALIWVISGKTELFRWFGNLPGDIKIEKENFKFYFPLTTMIIVSAAITFLLWMFKKIV